MNLLECKINKSVIVEDILCDKKIRKHLIDMGITQGVSIKIKSISPMKDPLIVSVRGYVLSLRNKEAQAIIVRGNQNEL